MCLSDWRPPPQKKPAGQPTSRPTAACVAPTLSAAAPTLTSCSYCRLRYPRLPPALPAHPPPPPLSGYLALLEVWSHAGQLKGDLWGAGSLAGGGLVPAWTIRRAHMAWIETYERWVISAANWEPLNPGRCQSRRYECERIIRMEKKKKSGQASVAVRGSEGYRNGPQPS